MFREAQTRQKPPVDTPWSFFDLSDIALFLGDEPRCLEELKSGIDRTAHGWQIATHITSLELIPAIFPALAPALAMLRVAEEALNLEG